MGWSIPVMDLAILPNRGATEAISRGTRATLRPSELLSTGFQFFGIRLLVFSSILVPAGINDLFGNQVNNQTATFSQIDLLRAACK